MTDLALHLLVLRRRSGVSQQQIADVLGQHQGTVSAIENGRQIVSALQLARWLDVVGASAEERVEALRLAGDGVKP